MDRVLVDKDKKEFVAGAVFGSLVEIIQAAPSQTKNLLLRPERQLLAPRGINNSKLYSGAEIR